MSDLINSDSSVNTDVQPLPVQEPQSGDSPQVPTPASPHGVSINFAETPTPTQLCSSNVCEVGHAWPPVIATTTCPGCSTPILVVKMVNCPICNEPPQLFRLRTDHLPQGGAILPMCTGSPNLGDIGTIEIVRSHAKDEEQNHVIRDMISKI